MNIAVFDVPAESGGPLSVLNDFYNQVLNHKNDDVQWFFILSTPMLKSKDNVKILNFKWIKKSWFHRLCFDYVIAPRLVKKIKADVIFTMQNIVVPRTKIKQILYMHQPIPFVDYKFKWNDCKILWIHQNIISKNIYSSIKVAQKTIVQTEWIKKACIEKTGINEKRISVIHPKVENVNSIDSFIFVEESFLTFFYPASSMFYKNHKVILEACKLLVENGITQYKVIFTLEGNESSEIMNIHRIIKSSGLPIKFIGNISRDEVYKYYQKSVLLFPSYVETFGLPLLEARLHKTPIIVSNCSFAHEILENYPNTYYFDTFNSGDLFKKMKYIIKEKKYYEPNKQVYNKNVPSKSLIDNILS